MELRRVPGVGHAQRSSLVTITLRAAFRYRKCSGDRYVFGRAFGARGVPLRSGWSGVILLILLEVSVVRMCTAGGYIFRADLFIIESWSFHFGFIFLEIANDSSRACRSSGMDVLRRCTTIVATGEFFRRLLVLCALPPRMHYSFLRYGGDRYALPMKIITSQSRRRNAFASIPLAHL